MPLPPPTPARPIQSRSPERFSVRTRVTEEGLQLYTTREWSKGERAAYCREVLNREPFQGES